MRTTTYNSLTKGFTIVALAGLLGACVASVDDTLVGTNSTVSTPPQTELAAQWRAVVKADLSQRLPLQLAQTLTEATPPRLLMTADVKTDLDNRLSANFRDALDGVTLVSAP